MDTCDFTGSVSRRRRRRQILTAVGVALAMSVGVADASPAPTTLLLDAGERSVFVPITPCRVMDTRASEPVGSRSTPLGPNETHTITVRGTNGNCTLPTDAVGVVMNVAVIDPTAASFLTVFPADVAKPLAANVNWVAGEPPVSNAVTSDISAGGAVSFYNLTGTVNLAADVVGYYVDHAHDDRYYTEPEIDTKFASVNATVATKANAADVTTALAGKVGVGTVYTKAESDARGVRAGALVDCGPSPGLQRAFNFLPGGAPITVTWSTTLNACLIEFGTGIARSIVEATPNASTTSTGPTAGQCAFATSTSLACQRFNTMTGAISPGLLHIVVI